MRRNTYARRTARSTQEWQTLAVYVITFLLLLALVLVVLATGVGCPDQVCT